MTWLWARLHTRIQSTKYTDTSETLGYMSGSFEVLVQALADKLRAKQTNIVLGTSVQSLGAAKHSVTVQTAEAVESYDAVIATVPNSVLRLMLPDETDLQSYRDSLLEVPYIGAVCLVFFSSQSLLPYYWVNVNDPAIPFIVAIQHTQPVDPADYQGEHAYYLCAYLDHQDPLFLADDTNITDQFFTGLQTMCSEFDTEKVTEKHLFKSRFAQHIVETNYPDKKPDYRTPIDLLYLSNFSQIFPEDRGINFAVREGKHIATLVSADLGHS